MTFYYNVTDPNAKVSRGFYDVAVYHYNDLPDSCILAPTPNLNNATYFLRTTGNCYVDLSAVYASYSTSHNNATSLHNVKLQYVPESLI